MVMAMRVRCAVLAAGLGAPAVGAAQSVRPMLAVGGGLLVANGAYHSDQNEDGFNTGWQGMMLVGAELHRRRVVVRVNASYGQNGAGEKLKGDLSNSLGQPTDAKVTLLGATLDVAWEFGRSFRRGYLFGGGGPYHVRMAVTSGGVTADTTATKFAWNVGGGVTWDARSTTLFLEVRYCHVAAAFGAPAVTVMPISAGIRFGGR